MSVDRLPFLRRIAELILLEIEEVETEIRNQQNKCCDGYDEQSNSNNNVAVPPGFRHDLDPFLRPFTDLWASQASERYLELPRTLLPMRVALRGLMRRTGSP